MNTQCVGCKPSEGDHHWSPELSQKPEEADYTASECVGRSLIKGISIATAATIVLPVAVMLLLRFLMGTDSITESVFFFKQIGSDLASVLLVLNFVLVFLGLSVPDIVQRSQRH